MSKKIKELSIYERTSLGWLEDAEEVEKKDLLLKDLCARLPYGVKCKDQYGDYINVNIYNAHIEHLIDQVSSGVIKMILRPMSSMTENEKKEYAKVIVKSQDCSLENSESATTMANDWLLSKGFDVRGLIPKGLALVAPDGMYK